MSVSFDKEVDYERLIEKLAEKTEEGKLEWQETATPDCFLTNVKGQQSFEIRSTVRKPTILEKQVSVFGEVTGVVAYRLQVKDGQGNVVIAFNSETPMAHRLFNLARRIALRIDQRLDEAVGVLERL